MLFVISLAITMLAALFQRFEKSASLLLSAVMAWLAGSVSELYSFDTGAYKSVYNFAPSTNVFEKGYMQVSYWFWHHGVTYENFRLYTYIFAYMILLAAVFRFTPRPALFYSFYGVVFFIEDATQVRNFWMFVVVMLTFSIYKEKSKFRYLLLFVGILVASRFQSLAILYFLVPIGLLVPAEKLVKFSKYLIVAFTSVTLALAGLGSLSVVSGIVNKLIVFSTRDNYSQMLNEYAGGNGISQSGLGIVLAYLIAIFFTYWYVKNEISIATRISLETRILYLVSLTGLIGLPLSLLSSAFHRIPRNALFGIFLIFTLYLTNRNPIFLKTRGIGKLLMFVVATFAVVGFGYIFTGDAYLGHFVPYMLHFLK